jgi:hypothetical protein
MGTLDTFFTKTIIWSETLLITFFHVEEPHALCLFALHQNMGYNIANMTTFVIICAKCDYMTL